jgi:hypothetical protein
MIGVLRTANRWWRNWTSAFDLNISSYHVSFDHFSSSSWVYLFFLILRIWITHFVLFNKFQLLIKIFFCQMFSSVPQQS